MSRYKDLRDDFIARVVEGRTFADVGGLWGTINEKTSVAYQCGATAITMIDVTPFDGDLWQKYDKHMQALGITTYQRISHDVCGLNAEDVSEPYDVVHCSGVLYHHPNPMVLLSALRNITRRYLILTSAITQEFIENINGRYHIPPSGIVFVPALSDAERNILSTYWKKLGVVAYGLTDRCAYTGADFGPWWWLPTAKSLEAMCVVTGFTVVDSGFTWDGNAYTLLLEGKKP